MNNLDKYVKVLKQAFNFDSGKNWKLQLLKRMKKVKNYHDSFI